MGTRDNEGVAHTVTFRPSGRGKAQCAPDPAYPDGVIADASGGNPRTCTIDLPYPAPECGLWIVRCLECDFSLGITAAGRADDPKRVTVPCGTLNRLRDPTPMTEEEILAAISRHKVSS